MMITDTYSIFWREMKRYKKSRGGFIIRLIQPAVWIIVMGNIFSGTQPLIESVGFDGEYIEFMTPGIIILTAIFTSIFGGVNTLWDRRYGFMNMALCSPISRSSIALGKMLAISLIAAIQATLILGIALAIGVTIPNLLMIGPIMAIVILFSIGFSGISVMFAAAAKISRNLLGNCQFSWIAYVHDKSCPFSTGFDARLVGNYSSIQPGYVCSSFSSKHDVWLC